MFRVFHIRGITFSRESQENFLTAKLATTVVPGSLAILGRTYRGGIGLQLS